MTNREFFTAVAALENIDPALVEHAQTALTKMDETNAKRKEKNAEKPSKWAEENAELIEQAYTALGTETKTAAEVAEALGTSTSKATHLLKHLVATERATVEDIKAPKKGQIKAYTAVVVEA
jgi:response regulator of citrate/malate metabolism